MVDFEYRLGSGQTIQRKNEKLLSRSLRNSESVVANNSADWRRLHVLHKNTIHDLAPLVHYTGEGVHRSTWESDDGVYRSPQHNCIDHLGQARAASPAHEPGAALRLFHIGVCRFLEVELHDHRTVRCHVEV